MLVVRSKTSAVLFVLLAVAFAGRGGEYPNGEQAAAPKKAKPLLTFLAGDASNLLQTHGIVFSADGRRVVVNGQHGVLWVWDIATGESVFEIGTLARPMASAPAISPDGKYVAAGVRSAIAVWDNQGVLIRRLKGQTRGIFGVTFSPDGRYLAAAGSGLSLWEFATGREVLAIASKDLLFSVAFSRDGRRLASAGKQGVLRVWSVPTGRELQTIRQGGTLGSVCFSPDGTRIAAGEYDSGVTAWDVKTGKRLMQFPGGASMAYSPDGKYLATARSRKDEDGDWLTVWDTATGKEVLTIRGNRQLAGLTFSPDSRLLGSVSYTAVADVWDVAALVDKEDVRPLVVIAEEREPATARRAAGAPARPPMRVEKRKPLLAFGGQETEDRRIQSNSIRFTCDGSRLVGIGLDGRLQVWDATSGKQLLIMAAKPTAAPSFQVVWDVAVSPDGRRLASAHEDKSVRVWDAGTGRLLLEIGGYTDVPLALTFSPTGNQLAVGDKDGGVRLWSAETGKEVRRLVGHAERVVAVSYALDGKRLVTAGLDGTARVWEVASGKELLRRAFGGSVHRSLFSRDGHHIVSAVQDARGTDFVSVWDSSTGKESFRLPGSSSLAFSADGKRLATSAEEALCIWDAATGRLLLAIEAVNGVTGLAFAPDGKRVAAVTAEYAVKIWDATIPVEVRK